MSSRTGTEEAIVVIVVGSVEVIESVGDVTVIGSVAWCASLTVRTRKGGVSLGLLFHLEIVPYTSSHPRAAVKGFHIMKLIEWKGTRRAYRFGLVSLRCLRHVSFYCIRFFSKAHDFWGLSQLPSCQCHLFASNRFSGLFLPLEVIGIVTDVMTDVSLGPVGYPIRQPTIIFQVMVAVA